MQLVILKRLYCLAGLMDAVTCAAASEVPGISQPERSVRMSESSSQADMHAESSYCGAADEFAAGQGAAAGPPAGNALAAELLSALLPLPAAGTVIMRAAAERLRCCAERLAASVAGARG